MEKYIVSFQAINCDYYNTIEVLATSEDNAIAQIQAKGHIVHWACKVELVNNVII